MSNVQNDTSTEPRVLDMSNVEDAILARWEDADESQPSEDEQGATPEPEEETQGELEFEEAEEPDEELEEEEDSEVEADDDTETEDESDDDMVIDISDDHEVEVLVDGEEHSYPSDNSRDLPDRRRASLESLRKQLDREKKQKMRLARATFLCRKCLRTLRSVGSRIKMSICWLPARQWMRKTLLSFARKLGKRTTI